MTCIFHRALYYEIVVRHPCYLLVFAARIFDKFTHYKMRSGQFCLCFEHLKAKILSASGAVSVECGPRSVQSLNTPHYKLKLRARHETPTIARKFIS